MSTYIGMGVNINKSDTAFSSLENENRNLNSKIDELNKKNEKSEKTKKTNEE